MIIVLNALIAKLSCICGDGGNRIPVQKVIAKKSTYIARLWV